MSFAGEGASLPAGECMLLTGSTGQVGRELLRILAPLGKVVAPSRVDMDLANADSVRDLVRRVRPRWIINAGAYTAVDKAETESEIAYAVNAEAVAVMAEEALAMGAGVLHFSTDYVFDGTKPEPYLEEDATGPICVYGRTKLAGEQALGSSGVAHAIFRTSWVFGREGKNFLLTILGLARERDTLQIVEDQHGAPTWSQDLARMAARFLRACETRSCGGDLREALKEVGGLYHASGSGSTTWYGFASEALAMARAREPAEKFAAVQPTTTAEFPTPARRPANSRLNCSKLEDRTGWRMMDWRESLGKVMAEL